MVKEPLMKLIIYYFSALALAWLGLNAILIAVAYWDRDGALAPLVLGLLVTLGAVRLILATVRLYTRPKSGRGRGLLD